MTADKIEIFSEKIISNKEIEKKKIPWFQNSKQYPCPKQTK